MWRFSMSRLLLGTICGLVYGALSAASMIPLQFTDKRAALAGAFLKRFSIMLAILLCLIAPATLAWAQPAAQESKQPAKNPEPRTKAGKRLLTALDLMKGSSVASPRISPEGTRVAYTAAEIKMEKDKEWKSVTQIWVIPISGGRPQQYTRGDKS